MKNFEAQERTRELADEVRQSLVDRFQRFIEEAPQIIEDLRRTAAKQLEEMELISRSGNDKLQQMQEMFQKALEQIEKARS